MTGFNFRLAPGRCCCSSQPHQGCDNPPDTIDQSNIPPFVTVTLGNCEGMLRDGTAVDHYHLPCLEGKSVTLPFEKCTYVGSAYIYTWRTTLGTCPDGSTYGMYFNAYFEYSQYYPGNRCYTRYCIYNEDEDVGGCLCSTPNGQRYWEEWDWWQDLDVPGHVIPWDHRISVAEVAQLGASIGGGGDPAGVSCGGYGNTGVAFDICKSKHNFGPYYDGGYLYPDACCPDKGPTELICTLNGFSDVLISEFDSTCVIDGITYPSTTSLIAYLSQLNGTTVAFDWRYIQCGAYVKAFGCANIGVAAGTEITEPKCGEPYFGADAWKLQIYLAVDQSRQSLMRIIDTWYGCVQTGWLVKACQAGSLPDCLSSSYDGASISFPWGTVTVEEAIYCDMPGYDPWVPS